MMIPSFERSKTIYPWREWFVYATLTLKLRPQEFWHLSLKEWQWILNSVLPDNDGLSRQNLLSLVKHYPDQYYGRTDKS